MILLEEGQAPLILCLPHSGTDVPNAVGKRFNATGRLQTDLAWRLERVFDLHGDLDATVLRSSISRYVIDLDRDPATPVTEAAKPAQALCPATTLDGKRIYQDGEEPGPTEVDQRVLLFHAPFHVALARQVERLLRQHRKVVVIDCQSMRSSIKGVTDKGLPAVSIGSRGGSTCDPDLRNLLVGSFSGQQGFTVGVDDQILGGYITARSGRPAEGLHAMTLLLAQRTYLRHESPPFEPDKVRITRLRAVLNDALSRLIDWATTSGAPNAVPPGEAEDPEGAPAQAGTGQEQAETPAVSSDGDVAAAGSGSEPAVASGGTAPGAPLDPATLPRADLSREAPVEDGPVKPLLVAE